MGYERGDRLRVRAREVVKKSSSSAIPDLEGGKRPGRRGGGENNRDLEESCDFVTWSYTLFSCTAVYFKAIVYLAKRDPVFKLCLFN